MIKRVYKFEIDTVLYMESKERYNWGYETNKERKARQNRIKEKDSLGRCKESLATKTDSKIRDKQIVINIEFKTETRVGYSKKIQGLNQLNNTISTKKHTKV
jgi:hypothetical protein